MAPAGAMVGLAVVFVVIVAGCSGDAEEPPAGDGTTLRVVVPDGLIRPEGAECGGSRPYRQVHEGTPYTVETGEGVALAEGELPAGRAENAEPGIDWEDLERIPTVCVTDVAVGELPEHPAYRLHIEGVDPLPFTVEDVAAGTPIVLMVEG